MSKGKMQKKTGVLRKKALKEVRQSTTAKNVVAKKSKKQSKQPTRTAKPTRLTAVRTSSVGNIFIKDLALTYEATDHILGQLSLPDPCPVKIKFDPEHAILQLFVGPRDFQWSMETGEFVASGTMLAEPVADETPATTATEITDEEFNPDVTTASPVEQDEEKIVR